MKKQFSFLSSWNGVALIGSIALLAACGDEVTQINQMGMDVVASEDGLPKCSKDNEGEQAYVKDDDSMRLCVAGEWKTVSSGGSDVDFSCKTVELEDKSGLKIVCNGDSIGVVLNGEKGADGKQGKDGKDGEDGKDGADAVTDTSDVDPESTPVSLDSIVGYTQKGPFLKGSTVYLYELSNQRTLKQTNGNFTSIITSDDGRYKFNARDLVSEFAMVVVDGYYRNEVTGNVSDAPIRLTALTNMMTHRSVNVNLLTHMEYERVYKLVTRGKPEMVNDSLVNVKQTVKHAKIQAQSEILKQFHIDLGDAKDAEDMDVFGKTDADAALLAISVLLQGDGSASDLSVLLTEISNDITEYGEWRNPNAKMRLAEWALKADDGSRRVTGSLLSGDLPDGRFPNIRKNVAGWHLSDNVPDFEKYIRNFYTTEIDLGTCGSASIPEGTVKEARNPTSIYYAKDYSDTSKTKERFICADAKTGRWRFAKDIEKDTATWGQKANDGDLSKGRITGTTYVYESSKKAWRRATITEATIGLCRPEIEDSIGYAYSEVTQTNSITGDTIYMTNPGGPSYKICKSGKWEPATRLQVDTYRQVCSEYGQIVHGRVDAENRYLCYGNEWRQFFGNENMSYATFKDERDGQYYRTVQIGGKTVMAENLNFDYKITDPTGAEVSYGNRCKAVSENSSSTNLMTSYETCGYGRFYSWAAAMDSAAVFTDSSAGCGKGITCEVKLPARGVCPEGWHIPTRTEWDEWISVIASVPYSLQAKGLDSFPDATDESGFSAVPAGYYSYSSLIPSSFVDSTATFWTVSESDMNYITDTPATNAYYLSIGKDDASLKTMQKNNLVPIRCFKD